MQSRTHTCRYRDHDISIVGFEMLDGWHLAVQVKPRWKQAWPVWRDKGGCYEEFADVQVAGMAWACRAIDARLPICAQA